jgi:hemerythrin-like metal-binding protein
MGSTEGELRTVSPRQGALAPRGQGAGPVDSRTPPPLPLPSWSRRSILGPVRASYPAYGARRSPRVENTARPVGAEGCEPHSSRVSAPAVIGLRWSDALLVGDSSIDGGHRTLAALVDAIERAVSRGEDAREVGDLLLRLAEDTKDHFDVESALMRATGFAGREAHEGEHERLLGHVSMLLSNHVSGKSRATVDHARSLRDWLMRHVEESDSPLAGHLRESADPLTKTTTG